MSMTDISLRTSLFQQYTRLQVWLLSRIVWYLAMLYLVSLAFFALLRLFTGISVKRIGYFSLRHIILTPQQGVEIRIGKLGIAPHRPTVARPGFLAFIVSNLEIFVDPNVTIEKDLDASHKEDEESNAKSKASDDPSDESDPFSGIPLLPRRYAFLFKLVRWVVTQMRVFDVQFHSVSLVFTDVMTVILTSINLRLDLRKTRNYNVSNFIGTLDTYKLSEGELPINAKLSITDVYLAESLEDESPWQAFEDLRFDISGVLNVADMRAKEIGIQIHSGRIQLDISMVVEMLEKVKKIRSAKVSKENTPSDTDRSDSASSGSPLSSSSSSHHKTKLFSEEDKKRMVRAAMLVLHLVHKVQINVGIVEVLKVPVDSAYFATRMKDMNLDISRMNSQSSGFKLFYDEGDIAHQTIFTVASVTAGIDTGNEQEEIFYVPLATSLTRGNLFSQTLRFVQEKDKRKNESMIRSGWVFHSPNVNIQEHQIPTLVQVALGLNAKGKSSSSSKNVNETTVDDFGFTTQLPFHNFLPNVDLDITVNNPGFRLVCEDTEVCKNSMFAATSSRYHMELQSRHKVDTDSYSGVAVVETFGDRGYYHSSTSNRIDIVASETTQLTVRGNTLPKFHVEVEGMQSDLCITALRHEIFCAIGQLHATARRPINKWRKTHGYMRSSFNDEDVVHKGTILRTLPQWLSKFSFEARNSEMSIATNKFRGRTNDILGLRLASSNFAVKYMANLSKEDLGNPENMSVESATDGRRLEISGSDLTLFKADKLLLEQEDEPSITSQHTVTQMPKLGVCIRTHNYDVATIELNIEPRLRIDLNINLILAFSVVREIIDQALLRHSKEFEEETPSDSEQCEIERQKLQQKISHEKHNITLKMPRALIKIDMPSDDQVMIELGASTVLKLASKNPILHTKTIKLYSQHPFKRTSWCILMSMNKVDAEYELEAKPREDDRVKLNVGGMRINVPYKFKLYRIIDNGITLAKAIKTLLLQTKNVDWMIVLDPKRIEKIPDVPRIRLKTKQLQISLEDDYFESDLTLIMLTRASSATIVRKKIYSFETRLKSMLREGLRALESSGTSGANTETHTPSPQRTLHEVHTINGEHIGHSEEKVSDRVHHAASNIRKTATVFIDHLHEPKNHVAHTSENSHSGASYNSNLHSLGKALQHVSKQKIEELLNTGVELGCPADDADFEHSKDHIWLEFWSSPEFKEFRKQKVLLADETPGKLTINEARHALLENLSQGWIDTIRRERGIQHMGAKKRRNEVFEDELNPHTCEEESIVDYSQKPLLMSIDFRQLDLTIDKTQYDTQEKFSTFLHEIGKGQPKDTDYSICVPLFLDLRAHGGLRVDIKDFPLPVLHFPGLSRSQDPKTNLALQIKGDLIVTEQLTSSEQSIRKIFVPLKSMTRVMLQKRSTDVLEVHRTLTPIKTFTNLKFHVGSTVPTRVCWSMAYKPGFHSVGESFSGFSKPPIDPSPALGFWDKIRLVFHARLDFKLPKSPLCLCLKAGKSPYSLLNDSSGFVFAWRENIHVQINPDDNPKELFTFNSDVFELLVPNYMYWEREFLRATPGERALPRKNQTDRLVDPEKVVFSFAQRTTWKLGMMFEKTSTVDPNENQNSDKLIETRDSDFRNHYDVALCMPEYIDNIDDYDAYKGFRSDFIYMAISVVSRQTEEFEQPDKVKLGSKANKCAAHLSLGVLKHFKYWKNQFNGEQWPPIKTGSLFPDPVRVRPSNKTFSTALSTAQYQIALQPLDLSFFHQMRHHAATESHDRCTGLKGKIENFEFDWHTRREPPVVMNDDGTEGVELRGHRRWKMKSHIGEVRLNSVQVQVVDATLRTQSTKAALRDLHDEDSDSDADDDSETASSTEDNSTYYANSSKRAGSANAAGTHTGSSEHRYGPKYVGNDHWIDMDDYTEVGKRRNLRSRTPDVKVLPFMYAPQFNYLRSTDFSGRAVYVDSKSNRKVLKFGDINVHDCLITSEQPERAQAEILTLRRQNVEEQISDFKASLESMEGPNDPTPELQKKLKDLRDFISIGELNSKVLQEEIMHFHAVADEVDRGQALLKKRMANDFQEQLKYPTKTLEANRNASDSAVKRYGSADEEETSVYRRPSVTANDFSTFRNRYIIHAMHLKWNNSVRNLVYRMQTTLSEDKELDYVRCRRAVEYLEELVTKAEEKTKKSEAKSAKAHYQGKHKSKPSATGSEACDEDEKAEESVDGTENPQLDENCCRASDALDDTCNLRLKTLFDDLKDANEAEIAQKAHSVMFMSPRIQLVAEENPSKCLQVTARDIEVQVIKTYSKYCSTDLESAQIETRYGSVLNNSGFFVLSEADTQNAGIETLCLEKYSGVEEDNAKSWPPWIALELCYDPTPLKQFLVIEDVSFGIRWDQPNDLHVVSEGEGAESQNGNTGDYSDMDSPNDSSKQKPSTTVQKNSANEGAVGGTDSNENDLGTSPEVTRESKTNQDSQPLNGITQNISKTLRHHGSKGKALLSSLVVDAPRLVVNVDSVQFYTFYTVVTDLITYRDPLIKKREQAIDRVFLSNDFRGDYRAALRKIELLQKDILSLKHLHDKLMIISMNQTESNREVKIHLIKLQRECMRRMTQLMVVMRAFKTILRKNMSSCVEKLSKWSLLADSILLRMLSETGEPIAELYVRRVHYSKLSNDDNASLNRLTLSGVYARNLLPNTTYPMMLANYETDKYSSQQKEAIKVKWTRLDRVGGIPVMDNIEAILKPLHIQIEHGMFEKVVDFAFPIKNSSDGKNANTIKDDSSKTDDSEDDYDLNESDSDSDSSSIDTDDESSGGKLSRKGRAKNKLLFGKFGKSKKDRRGRKSADIEEMMSRASNYWSIRSLKVHPTQLTISYKGKSRYSSLNLQNLEIPMPLFVIHNKTCTKLDLIMRIRKVAVKTLLSQSGSIIGNMFKRHKHHTAEDDRDLGLEKLTSRPSKKSSDLISELRSEVNDVEVQSNSHGSVQLWAFQEFDNGKPTSEKESLLLVPVHRMKVKQDPDNAREIIMEAICGDSAKEKENKSSSQIQSPRHSSSSKRTDNITSLASKSSSQSMRDKSLIRRKPSHRSFDTTRDSHGTLRSLREQAIKHDSPGRKTLSKTSTFFDKIKNGFN